MYVRSATLLGKCIWTFAPGNRKAPLGPLHVQNFVTRTAMEIHNSIERQDSVHQDAMESGLSLGTCRV